MARKLLLVPILVVSLFVVLLDASAQAPVRDTTGTTYGSAFGQAAVTIFKPAGVGDGRRMK